MAALIVSILGLLTSVRRYRDKLGFVHRATIDVPVNPPACDTL